LGPGWHHDLDMETVGPGRIGKQLPAVRSIPQINQPQFVHKRVELGPSTLVQLDIDRNQHRPVGRPRDMNEIQREGSDGPGSKLSSLVKSIDNGTENS
jgi:hypothetical protein